MILAKFGGSILTNKQEPGSFQEETADRLCEEFAFYKGEKILVHGAGAYGHILAKEFGLEEGVRTPEQLEGVARIHRDVRELNLKVLASLRKVGLHGIQLSPFGLATNDVARDRYRPLRELNTDVVGESCHRGVVPVLFGDVVPDLTRQFSICSGDELMVFLARDLSPEIAVFVTDVDGVHDSEGHLIHELTSEVIHTISSDSSVPDVTGGMQGKARCALDIAEAGTDCWIINGGKQGRLQSLLRGESIEGTVARAAGK